MYLYFMKKNFSFSFIEKMFELQVLKPMEEINTSNEIEKDLTNSFERKQDFLDQSSKAHENTSTVNRKSRKQVHINN